MRVTHLGRFRSADAGRPTRDVLAERAAEAGRTGDYEPPAMKTEVARFQGEHHVSERDAETGDLVIYSIGNSDGIPGVETYTGDRAPKTLTDLQKTYDKAYERHDNFKQRADQHSAAESFAIGARNPVR